MQGSNFDLTPQEWAALRGLLDTALELPATERDAWVERLGAKFAGLKPRLRALLAHAGSPQVEVLLNTLPKVETGQFAVPPNGVAEDRLANQTQIGPYRLLRQLGEGGMAAVWLAERTDLLQRRKVALKLPHGAWRRAGLAERMAREREILATLEHPHIARLYDAGVADDGQPYLALEYVEGEPLGIYCARLGLTVEAKLRLFLQVLDAVAHAHARLVVHRDLKPSNILVDGTGQAKLLDFGIAKLIAEGGAQETALTHQVGRAMTPDYASPEQVAGLPIGVASDIYSLGVVLYELLSGQRPYRLKRESGAALEEAILQAEPPRPSVAAPPGLRRRLRGDLDTIVLKAMRKDAVARYPTVDALAQDIERTLSQRPVLARPDSTWYRLSRFVARNRLGVGAGSAVLATMLVGTAASLWQARVARAEQQRATEVNQFIVSLFRDADPYAGQGKPLAAVDLLQRARTRVDRIDPERVELRTELMAVLGESLLDLGAIDAAQDVLARAVSESTSKLGAVHPLTLRARLLMTDIQRERGQTDAMRAELDRLEPGLRERVGEHPELLVHGLENRAHLEIDDTHPDAAIRAGQEAFTLALARLGPNDTATVSASTVLAIAHQYETDTPQAALAEAQRGMRFAEAAHTAQPMHPQLIRMREFYADALSNVGDDLGALEQFERARREAQVAFGPASRVEGLIANNSVPIQRRVGLLKDAIESANLAHAIFQSYLPKDTRTWGVHLTVRGSTWIAARNGAKAVEDLAESRDVLSNSLGPMNGDALSARMNLGLALSYAGRLAEARGEVDSTLALYRRAMPEYLHFALYVNGIVARLDGRYEAAHALQQQALAATPADGRIDWNRLRVLVELGLNQVELANHAAALATLTEGQVLIGKLQRATTPMQAEIWLGLGRAHLAMGHAAQAIEMLERADAFWLNFDPANRWAGEAALWLARGYEAQGHLAEAMQANRRAKDLLSHSPFATDRRLLIGDNRR